MVHQKLDISVHRESNETIVALTGEIDLQTAPTLSSAVDEALVGDPARVVLDMGGVTFCDSRGLGTLVVLSRAVTRSRAVLVLANLDDFLHRLLSVSGTADHFVIRSKEQSVIRSNEQSVIRSDGQRTAQSSELPPSRNDDDPSDDPGKAPES